jgi:hypothetical protein
MPRFVALLAATVSVAAVTAGCQPEVVIARSESTSGSGGAVTTVAGAGAGSSGAGGMVEPLGGSDAGAPASVEAPRLLADSVADFSLTQGELGWYYGYDGGSLDTFALMTRKSVITQYVPVSKDIWDCWANDSAHWTQIFRLGAHPNGTITSTPGNALLQRAVRRWISTFAGDIVITGEVAKIDVTVNGSNGVDASVYVDGKLAYSTPIGGEDGGGLIYQVMTTVLVGSTVDFVLDAHENDDHHDLTRFTSVIERAQAAPSE